MKTMYARIHPDRTAHGLSMYDGTIQKITKRDHDVWRVGLIMLLSHEYTPLSEFEMGIMSILLEDDPQ